MEASGRSLSGNWAPRPRHTRQRGRSDAGSLASRSSRQRRQHTARKPVLPSTLTASAGRNGEHNVPAATPETAYVQPGVERRAESRGKLAPVAAVPSRVRSLIMSIQQASAPPSGDGQCRVQGGPSRGRDNARLYRARCALTHPAHPRVEPNLMDLTHVDRNEAADLQRSRYSADKSVAFRKTQS